MGDERGDSSTSLFNWIIYKSDQLEEVGVYWTRDSKKAPHRKRRGVSPGSSPTIEGLTGALIGQRVRLYGLAFAIDLRTSECG